MSRQMGNEKRRSCAIVMGDVSRIFSRVVITLLDLEICDESCAVQCGWCGSLLHEAEGSCRL